MRCSILALVLSCLVAACSDNSSGPSVSTPSCSLLPGDVGNWWIYADSSWHLGKLTGTGEDTLRVTGSTVLGGRAVQQASGGGDFPLQFIPRCDTLFVPSYGIGGHLFFTPLYIRGTTSLETLFTVIGDIGFSYSTQILAGPVVTEAGSFANCTHIALLGQNSLDVTVIFPGVGIVRRVVEYPTVPPVEGFTGKTYTLKKTNVVLAGR